MTWEAVMENIRLQAAAENRPVIEVMRDHRDACVMIRENITAPEELRSVVVQECILFDYALKVMSAQP